MIAWKRKKKSARVGSSNAKVPMAQQFGTYFPEGVQRFDLRFKLIASLLGFVKVDLGFFEADPAGTVD